MLKKIIQQRGLVDNETLDRVIAEVRETGGSLGRTLVQKGLIPEDRLADAISHHLGLSYVSLEGVSIDATLISTVSPRLANHYHMLPVSRENGVLNIAMAFPENSETIDEIRAFLKEDIVVSLAPMASIQKAIKQYYGIGADTLDQLDSKQGKTAPKTAPRANELEDAQEASVIKLVNQIFLEAYQSRATDIHIEPYQEKLRVRYRIDGVLYDAKMPGSLKRFQSAILSRIKIIYRYLNEECPKMEESRLEPTAVTWTFAYRHCPPHTARA
jgi:hypothetical protein